MPAPHAEPIWLGRARTFLGEREIAGPHHNPQILKLLDAADGTLGDGKTLQGIHDDETPWCATFVSAILELSGIVSARSAWARSYLKWGEPLAGAAYGAIAVLERGPTSGHVAFVVGRAPGDTIMLLGGNQSDMVRISRFDPNRVIGYRWPKGYTLPNPVGLPALPLLDSTGAPISTNEA